MNSPEEKSGLAATAREYRPGVWCLVIAVALAAAIWPAPVAPACPFCDGGTSGVNPVKAVVFGDDFWPNLACTALPCLVFLGIAALIHFAPPGRGREGGETPPESEAGTYPPAPGRRGGPG